MRLSIKALTGLTGSAFAALACSAVCLGAQATDAHAATRELLLNVRTGNCLAVTGPFGVGVTPCGYPPEAAPQVWISSGMGNGGYRLKNASFVSWYHCLDMSSKGLRMWGCHPASDVRNRIFQSWKVHHDPVGGSAGYRFQAMWGWGCLANYGTRVVMVGCTTPGHAGYLNQDWVIQPW